MQYTNGSSDAAVTNKNYCGGESAHLHRPMTSHIPLKTTDYSTKFWIHVLRHNHKQDIRQRGDKKISSGQGSLTSATTASNFSNSVKVFFHFSLLFVCFVFACCCWGVEGEGGLPSTLLWCVKYCHTAFNLFRVFDVMHVALLVKQGSVTI